MYAKHRCVAALRITLFLVFSLTSSVGASTVTFQPAVTYPVGTAPKAVAVGDFNGDGVMDLAVANSGDPTTGDDGNVSILFGNGDGTFQSANNVPGGKNPFAIATADFNRDNKADLVLIDISGVGVLLGKGDGTFRPVTYLATASGPLSLAVADFDGDNTLDLVASTQSSLSVLLGNGDGTFQAHVDYPAGGPNVCSSRHQYRCKIGSNHRRAQKRWRRADYRSARTGRHFPECDSYPRHCLRTAVGSVRLQLRRQAGCRIRLCQSPQRNRHLGGEW